MNADTYRDAFQIMLKQGKTPYEALQQFDRDRLNYALRQGIREEDVREAGSLFSLCVAAAIEEQDEKDMEQAIALWLAGWTSETPSPTQERVMSWYWRRPSRRKGKPGRLFLSTNQAFNAMMKEGQ